MNSENTTYNLDEQSHYELNLSPKHLGEAIFRRLPRRSVNIGLLAMTYSALQSKTKKK